LRDIVTNRNAVVEEFTAALPRNAELNEIESAVINLGNKLSDEKEAHSETKREMIEMKKRYDRELTELRRELRSYSSNDTTSFDQMLEIGKTIDNSSASVSLV